ncbi:hypothetical protein [Agromyces laixinhei]|uniref:hypothetical protein n=1 Tax=Agromyces laixinhei TaxID=2585717 RepID=UPI0018DDBA8F|nr:hypothetical protein [Agromyces laixinhei]
MNVGRRWPGLATTVWAVGYLGFGLVCVGTDTALLSQGLLPPGVLGWIAVVLGTVSVPVAGAATVLGPRPMLRVLLWILAGAAAMSAFSLLMDVLGLLLGQPVDSWPTALGHALAAVGAVLLAITAQGNRAGTGAVEPATAAGTDLPAAANGSVHGIAIVGTLSFLPYITMKMIWSAGGSFAGVTGAELEAISARNGASGLWLILQRWGLDPTVLLAGLGIFLLWGLVRPWGLIFPRWTPVLNGRRVPRWLPLTPALVGAATLLPYGAIGLGYATLVATDVVSIRAGDFPTPEDALLATWVGMIAFCGYGLALAAAANSYRRRTVQARPPRQSTPVP